MPFSFIDTYQQAVAATVPQREFEWDVDTREFVITNGRVRIVQGKPALKIWIYKALLTQRASYRAYTWNYGTDLDTLTSVNQDVREVLVSEAKRITEEALLINKHILALDNFNATMGDGLFIEFTARTDAGDIQISTGG